MIRRQVVLPSFNGVGAGQTATLDLATGRRYFGLYISYKTNAAQAVVESDITEIRVVVNGKVQRRFSAKQLNMINALNGVAFAAGMIQIFLGEPWLRTWQGEEGYAWGMGDVSTFKLEIDIAGGATAPTLSGFAEVDNATDKDGNPLTIGVIKKWKQFPRTLSAGVNAITDLPKIDAYSRIHFIGTAAIIDKVKAQVDSLDVFEVATAANAALLARCTPKLTQQANVFSLCFDMTQQGDSVLPTRYSNGRTINDLRFDITANAGGNIVILTETVGLPD